MIIITVRTDKYINYRFLRAILYTQHVERERERERERAPANSIVSSGDRVWLWVNDEKKMFLKNTNNRAIFVCALYSTRHNAMQR